MVVMEVVVMVMVMVMMMVLVVMVVMMAMMVVMEVMVVVVAVERTHLMEGRDSATAQSQGLLRGMAKSRVCVERE